jgi:hypothetical protein
VDYEELSLDAKAGERSIYAGVSKTYLESEGMDSAPIS